MRKVMVGLVAGLLVGRIVGLIVPSEAASTRQLQRRIRVVEEDVGLLLSRDNWTGATAAIRWLVARGWTQGERSIKMPVN